MNTRYAVAFVLCALQPRRAPAQAVPLEHFTVQIDGHPVALWARRPANAKGSILLVHGRTWSAIPDFDLQVVGESRSVLASLAARGYAAYAIDLRGYGATPRDSTGWNTPVRAAEDIRQSLDWITAKEKLATRPVLLGWSNGAMVAQLAAQRHPELMASLILYGYPWDPDATVVPDSESNEPAPREPNLASSATGDFRSPGVTSKRMIAAYVATAIKSDPIYAEWRRYEEFNELKPNKVRVPTLLLMGEHDLEPRDALKSFYARVATADKQWITLKGGDHAALLEDTKPTFVDAIVGFMERHHR